MHFVISGHGVINILLAVGLIILIGSTLLVFFISSKQRPVLKNILLKKLSRLWVKNESETIHISKLAPIWREQKKTDQPEQVYTFAHEQIAGFFTKHIDQAPWFHHAEVQRHICAQILLLLDKDGDCSSVVNAAKDVEASWDSNTYTMLSRTTLLDHTLNVARETISLLVAAEAQHVIPDALIAALGHDIGKLPSIKSYMYSLGEHPLAAGRLFAEIKDFKKLSKKDEISRAIKLHHKRPEGILGKTLKKADQLARQKELETAVEQFSDNAKESQTVAPLVHLDGSGAAWQAQADIYGEENVTTSRKSESPRLVDISKWFDAELFLKNLKPSINRVVGRKFMAFSMADGHVYFQPKVLEEVARKMAEQAGAMDITTMAANDSSMQEILFTLVHYLRVEHNVIARGLIKEGYFGGYFTIIMKSGKLLKGYYTPFHAEAFGSIAEMESGKSGLLKNFKSIEPYIDKSTD